MKIQKEMKIQEQNIIHAKLIGAVVLDWIQIRLSSELEVGISVIQTCVITPRFKNMLPEKSSFLCKSYAFS